ncbi:MAG: hypothetical protein VKN72_11850 [Nostocales cyanobacterium 94392]|nr:hypothetical protein [Nostocales cyanobacterium 94392]
MAVINVKVERISQVNRQRMHVLMPDPNQKADEPLRIISKTIRFRDLDNQEKNQFNKIADIISDGNFSDIEIDEDANICIDAFIVKSTEIPSGKVDKKPNKEQKADLRKLINLLEKIID